VITHEEAVAWVQPISGLSNEQQLCCIVFKNQRESAKSLEFEEI